MSRRKEKGWGDASAAYDEGALGWETRMAAESMGMETLLLLDLYNASKCPESQKGVPYNCIEVAGMAVAPWFIEGLQRETDGVSLGDRLLKACGGYMLDAPPDRDGRGLIAGADALFEAIDRACVNRVYNRRSAKATGPAHVACVLSREALLRPLGRGLLQTLRAGDDDTIANQADDMRRLFVGNMVDDDTKDRSAKGDNLGTTPLWTPSFLGSKYVQKLRGYGVLPDSLYGKWGGHDWYDATGGVVYTYASSSPPVEERRDGMVRAGEAYVGLFAIAQLAAALRLTAVAKNVCFSRTDSELGDLIDKNLQERKERPAEPPTGEAFTRPPPKMVFSYKAESRNLNLTTERAGMPDEIHAIGSYHSSLYKVPFLGSVSVAITAYVPETAVETREEFIQWLEDHWAECDVRLQFVEQVRTRTDPGPIVQFGDLQYVLMVPDVQFETKRRTTPAAKWSLGSGKHYASRRTGSELLFKRSSTSLSVADPWGTAIVASMNGFGSDVKNSVCLMHSMHGLAVGRMPLCAAAPLLRGFWLGAPVSEEATFL